MRWSLARSELLVGLTTALLGAIACGSAKGDDLFADANGEHPGGGSGGSPAGTGGSIASGGSAGASGGGSGGGLAGASGGGSTASGGTDGSGGSGGSGGSAGVAGASGGSGGSTGGGAGAGGDSSCTPPADEICDGVDNDCNASVDDDACPASCQGLQIDGQSYMFCDDPVSLSAASEQCSAQGMRLAWIESADENAALVKALAPLASPDPNDTQGPGLDPGVRIGATDRDEEGDWRWIDGFEFWEGGRFGEPVDDAFANWGIGRPNNGGGMDGGEQCAVLLVRDGSDGLAGKWNDVRCDQPHPFVCELP